MMHEYMIFFKGRKLGAIGVFYDITAIRSGENKQQAIRSLYKDYDLFMWPADNNIIELKKQLKKEVAS